MNPSFAADDRDIAPEPVDENERTGRGVLITEILGPVDGPYRRPKVEPHPMTETR